ncbi:unnamed protein product [Calypogeia fissa]
MGSPTTRYSCGTGHGNVEGPASQQGISRIPDPLLPPRATNTSRSVCQRQRDSVQLCNSAVYFSELMLFLEEGFILRNWICVYTPQLHNLHEFSTLCGGTRRRRKSHILLVLRTWKHMNCDAHNNNIIIIAAEEVFVVGLNLGRQHYGRED